MNTPFLTRRTALLGLGAAWTLGGASLALAAAPTDQRFVVVILRGALDGMAAVVPYGDRDLATWRPELVPGAPGSENGMLDLGGFYGLHPALAGLHDMYSAGELLPVHAVAGHYRSRSHFEAQDYMESGADQRMTSGWLNRVVAALPANALNRSPGGPGPGRRHGDAAAAARARPRSAAGRRRVSARQHPISISAWPR